MNKSATSWMLTVLLFTGLMLSGCAMLRGNTTPEAVGVWNYTVLNTPEGDAPGTVTITWVDGIFAGHITNELLQQTSPLTNISFDDDTLSFVAVFDINGQDVPTTTTVMVEDDTVEGSMEVPGFGTFSVNGSRVTMGS